MKRMLLSIVVVGLSAQISFGGGRVMSVYLESISALHAQLFQAAQVFEAPQLGTAPMMLNMMVPGYAQVDRDAPVGLHIYIGEEEQYGFVVDLKTVGAAEPFLGALLAAQGAMLPEPVDGRYVTDEGAAQVLGNRVILANSAEVLDLALFAGLPQELPAVAGVLRTQVAPQHVLALFGNIEEMMTQAMPDGHEHADMFDQLFGFYRAAFEQIALYETGFSVREDGLVIRSRVTPAAGRALERIVASLQGIDPAWLVSLEGDNLFGIVAGKYEVPKGLLQLLVNYYITWLQSMPVDFAMEPELVEAMFEPALQTAGAPWFLTANMSSEDGFRLSSGMRIDDAARVLQKMMGLMASEAYQRSMTESGFSMSQAEPRVVEGVDVYRWAMDLDEEIFRAKIEEAGGDEVDSEQFEMIQKMMSSFFSGYDYAATSDGLVFGVTDDAGLAEAIRLLGDEEGEASATGQAMLDRIGAPVLPFVVARYDYLALLHMVQTFVPDEMPTFPEKGEGFVYAAWRADNGIEQAVLIPAADINAIRNAFTAAFSPF